MPSLRVDGRTFEAGADRCALQALLELGFHLPYFCWHPALGSVGACRQCAVKQYKDEADEHAGKGRLVMSCMTAVAEGLRLGFAEAEAADFRRSVIEGLMLHHPHDCPVCDEGGQCHLQDMTVMAGHDYRRYRFDKRTFRNQYLGPFVNHEMNRCIQCYRCVRFYREYAGGGDLEAMSIRDRVYFGRERDGALESEFAGNLVEVCPTGVFTDATLKRHYTRKWDLRWAPSLCAHCGAGCNTSLGERYGQVRVTVNRYHGEINSYFLCDRGRFGYEYLASADRIRAPRWQGAPVDPDAALTKLQELVAEARRHGPGRILGFGSPRASLEANFLLRELVGRERFFSADPDGALAAEALALLRHGPAPAASLREAEASDAVLILGEDLTQSAARLALSLRQAARRQPLREICDPLRIPHWLDHAAREAIQNATGPVYVLTPAATGLDDVARAVRRAAPADLARFGFAIARRLGSEEPELDEWRAEADPIAAALLAAEHPLIVTGASCGSSALLAAAAQVAAALRARGRDPRLNVVLPEANAIGLAALAPESLQDGLDWGRFDGARVALVLEADLTRLAPPPIVDGFLARFREPDQHLIVLDQIEHPTAAAAALVLPAAGVAEGDGTLVSFEGRAQRYFQVLPPQPGVRESWRWLQAAQGDAANLDGVLARLAASAPELAGAAQAAPSAAFRLAQQKMPREPARCSGRTAIHAAQDVSEPRPPEDPDAALTFTMEGYAAQPPAALTAFFWAPGWNSPQAQLPYEQAINGSLRGGDAGVRLFEAGGSLPAAAPPAAFAPQAGRFWVLRLPRLFGGEELSRRGRAIAQRVAPAYIAVNAAAAAAARWSEGSMVRIQLDGVTAMAPLRIMPELPAGLAVVPAGFAAFDAAALPAWGEIE